MQDEVLRLWENRRTTMLLVTHDIDEAIYMSDRILIMTQAPGRIDREIDIDLARPRDRTSDSFLASAARFSNICISPAKPPRVPLAAEGLGRQPAKVVSAGWQPASRVRQAA